LFYVILSIHETTHDDIEQTNNEFQQDDSCSVDDILIILFFLYFYLLQLSTISHMFINSTPYLVIF